MKAKIAEIFKSFQGEGIYQGALQIFIRFFGCNLNCQFCDTMQDKGSEFSCKDLMGHVSKMGRYFHSLSLTGGEPLLQKNFLKKFLPLAKRKKIKTYLETNGTLHKELSEVIKYIDIISMDIKLPSSTGNQELWMEHDKFLDIALKKDVFVKAVICNSTREGDLVESLNLVKRFDRSIPFVLQPEYNEMVYDSILSEKLEEFLRISERYLNFVRVIPQRHKIMGIR